MGSPSTEPTEDRLAGISEEKLYRIIRSAVEDAILGVLGTLLLLGIAVFFVWLGGIFLLGGSPVELVFGVLFSGFGLYLGGATLGLIPTIREWAGTR